MNSDKTAVRGFTRVLAPPLTAMQESGYNGIMRSDYMKPDNYGKLFVFMGYENVLVLRVSLETGMRIGDILKMKPSELRGRTITYIAEKTGKRGKAVISMDLANRLREVSGEHFVFPKRGDPRDHRRRQTVWLDVKRAVAALRAAGVLQSENVTPHSARKTFAVEDMERHGIRHTQQALQHSNKLTTQLYTDSDKAIGAADWSGVNRRLDQIEENIFRIMEMLEKIG